jgi:hypothetical protein
MAIMHECAANSDGLHINEVGRKPRWDMCGGRVLVFLFRVTLPAGVGCGESAMIVGVQVLGWWHAVPAVPAVIPPGVYLWPALHKCCWACWCLPTRHDHLARSIIG